MSSMLFALLFPCFASCRMQGYVAGECPSGACLCSCERGMQDAALFGIIACRYAGAHRPKHSRIRRVQDWIEVEDALAELALLSHQR